MLANTFGTGQVFWSFLWFTLFFIWIWLLIVVFADVFRSHDLSGWGKALWTIFIIVVPYLGVFVYLIARGKKMQQHSIDEAKAQDAAFREYVQNVTPGATSAADGFARLADLRSQGVIDEAEFQQAKARVLQRAHDAGLTALIMPAKTDERVMGPISYLIVEFPGSKMTGEGFPILVDLVDRGLIRILDLLFVAPRRRRLDERARHRGHRS